MAYNVVETPLVCYKALMEITVNICMISGSDPEGKKWEISLPKNKLLRTKDTVNDELYDKC